MKSNIRILEISIKNIKNVKQGRIEFSSKNEIENGNFEFDHSDVIGIYGPNGSSKTALVNSFNILKNIIVSKNINDNEPFINHFDGTEVFELINKNANSATLELMYFTDVNSKKIFFYEVEIIKNENAKIAQINKEKLSYKSYSDELKSWSNKVKLIEVDYTSENTSNFISPLVFVITLKKYDKNVLGKFQRLIGTVSSTNSSFIFSDTFISNLAKIEFYKKISSSLNVLKKYAVHNMHVYDNKEISKITANDAIPFFYKSRSNNIINTFFGQFSIFGESMMDVSCKQIVSDYFKEIDIVINKIIPNMHVEVVDLGNAVLDNGTEGFKFEVLSIRNDTKIPLRLESDGIKKIISLITSLVDIFNNPSSILIIDEFDSGIFEYLLGELLKTIKDDAKGQFIFTSHNLRALEVIRESIIFSSLDENNRYISFPRISKTENLRSKYIKMMFLDNGNKFADSIDLYEIYRAFIRAGELINHE